MIARQMDRYVISVCCMKNEVGNVVSQRYEGYMEELYGEASKC